LTKVIHIKDTPPKYKENKDYVYIGRPGKGEEGYFGNPFSLKDYKNREECMEAFKGYFYKRLDDDEEYKSKILELKDKILVCFCKVNKNVMCHGDVFVAFLDKEKDYE